MLKEVLLYGSINSVTAENFINSINEIEANDDLIIRVNTGGGDVHYGFGMVAKYHEHKGKKLIKVDGSAYSMGAYFLAFADNVEALDVSSIMIHRAAYPSWYEKEYMSESEKELLIKVNSDLEKTLKNKLDIPKLEALKNIKFKDIFSMDGRLDVNLTAKEAKEIGLVNNIIKVIPAKKNEIKAELSRIAAFSDLHSIQSINTNFIEIEGKSTKEETNLKIDRKMTKEKFKIEYPEAYASIVNEGISAERDRTGAWLTFNEIDPKAVKDGIKSGENISQTAMAEFSLKKLSASSLEKIKDESAPSDKTVTAEVVEETQLTEAQKLEAKIDAELGLNVKKD